jgi:hypothetical protein
MAVLNKSNIVAPTLPEPQVREVPALGGEVLVRPLMLSDRLAIHQDVRTNGGAPVQFAHISALLAYAVVDANHEPIFTAEQWEAWGALHTAAALDLWDVAWAISGFDQESAEKKSPAQN